MYLILSYDFDFQPSLNNFEPRNNAEEALESLPSRPDWIVQVPCLNSDLLEVRESVAGRVVHYFMPNSLEAYMQEQGVLGLSNAMDNFYIVYQ